MCMQTVRQLQNKYKKNLTTTVKTVCGDKTFFVLLSLEKIKYDCNESIHRMEMTISEFY